MMKCKSFVIVCVLSEEHVPGCKTPAHERVCDACSQCVLVCWCLSLYLFIHEHVCSADCNTSSVLLCVALSSLAYPFHDKSNAQRVA